MRILCLLAILVGLLAGHSLAICCGAGGCTYCEDCTPATPFCATGPCNIFGCNCDGSCRTGTLCPIEAVGRRGQRVVAGPNCNIPYDRLAPHCAIVMPGRTSWEWVHACTTRGKRSIIADGDGYGQNLVQNDPVFASLYYDNVTKIVQDADQNNDEKLDYNEAIAYLRRTHTRQGQSTNDVHGVMDFEKIFRQMDQNGDNYFTFNEIDS